MAQTDYDVIINGTSAKVLRMEDGYLKRYVRREIDLQLLNQAESPAIASRGDTPGMYQTSWAAGAEWWKPLLQGQVDSYFTSQRMDTWSEPGKVLPHNEVYSAAMTSIHQNTVASGVYAIGSTNIDDAAQLDVYRWSTSSEAFVRETGHSSGVGTDDAPLKMALDPNDGYHYLITDDSHIERFNTTTNVEDTDWITSGFTQHPGCNIFLQTGELMFYSGDKLYTIDKAVPEVTQVFNDGQGPDYMTNMNQGGALQIAYESQITLAMATPQGVYYVKNTVQGGNPAPWVFRVNKNAAGQWIGEPIAELPLGSMALSIAWHMGSVVVSTTPDAEAARNNDGGDAFYEVVLYHITNDTMGAIGSVLGGRGDEDAGGLQESPYRILGADGPLLYLGSRSALYVYDAVRGGIHTAGTFTSGTIKGVFSHMVTTADNDADSVNLFLSDDYLAYHKRQQRDPFEVTDFDTSTAMTLTSNYFDGNIPMELKELTKIAIQHDEIDGNGNQQWKVQISVDDSAFTSRLTSNTAGSIFAESELSGDIGYRFQYKLIYETKDFERVALRSILVTFATGVMVPEWELMLDGTEMLNIDNEVQDPAAFRASLEAIAGTEAIITLVDNYQDIDQDVDSTATVDVKVQAIQVSKDAPEEAKIRVVLRAV